MLCELEFKNIYFHFDFIVFLFEDVSGRAKGKPH
jgi:hypothetical protein